MNNVAEAYAITSAVQSSVIFFFSLLALPYSRGQHPLLRRPGGGQQEQQPREPGGAVSGALGGSSEAEDAAGLQCLHG